MQHCDEGTIHAWLDGALDADEQKLIDRHVAECAKCAALVVEARGLIAGASRVVRSLDVVPAGVIPKQPTAPAKASRSVWRSLRFTPLRASLAATILIGVASMFAVRHDRPQQASVAESAAVKSIQPPFDASPAPAPVASPAVVSTPPRASAQSKTRAAEPKRQAQDSRAIATPAEPAPAPAALVVDADSIRRSTTDRLREAATSFAARDSALSVRAEQAIRPAAAFASGARPVLMDAITRESAAATTRLFVGCYRVAHDSTPTFVAFPERFALDRVGDTTSARNVVRAVGANGAMDSVVRTATWEADARNAVVVTWTTSSASQQLHLTALRNGQLDGAVREGARVQPLPINKVICGR